MNKLTYVDNVTVIPASNLNAIQDEVIANGTNVASAKSEVENIRVGADGTTYANAGDAVREQVKDVSSALDDLTTELPDKLYDCIVDRHDGYRWSTSQNLYEQANFSALICNVKYGVPYILNLTTISGSPCYFVDSKGINAPIQTLNSTEIYHSAEFNDVPDGYDKLYISAFIGNRDDTACMSYRQKTIVEYSTDVAGWSDLPGYYTDYLINKIADINDIMRTCEDSSIFITDIHLDDNMLESFPLMREILRKTSTYKVFMGGDIISAYGSTDDVTKQTELFQQGYNRNILPYGKYYSSRGNHDLTVKYTEGGSEGITYSWDYAYNVLHRKAEDYSVIDDRRGYYYIDNTSAKIRYIVLNTCQITDESVAWGVIPYIRYEQLIWLSDVALNVPSDDWHILVIGHVPMASTMASYSVWVQKAELILSAFVNRTVSESITVNDEAGNSHTFTKDFTGRHGILIGYICGHNHIDSVVTENDVISISVICDAFFDNAGYNRQIGTITEQAFDVVCIDKAERKLHLIRIGAGNDRVVDY